MPPRRSRLGRRDELDVVAIERPLGDLVGETDDVSRHVRRSELVEELEARVHRGHVLKRQRDELELARVVAPREVVVGEPTEIVGAAHGEPAHVVRLELLE